VEPNHQKTAHKELSVSSIVYNTKRVGRKTGGPTRMPNFWRYVRFGFRLLTKDPGFTAVALLALTLGIGANTAIFSVIYAALLAPMPYPNPNQLVMVWSHINGQNNGVSAGDFLDWKQQNTVFQDIVAWNGTNFSLSTSGTPELVQARAISAGSETMVGCTFSLGRDFLPEEGQLGKDHVVILTNQFWKEHFASDPQIIGKPIRMSGQFYTVVGVLTPGQPDRLESKLFVPLAFRPDQINHDFHWLLVMARMKPGVTLQQANANMDSVTRHIAEAYPVSNKNWGASVEYLQNDFVDRNIIRNLWLMMGAVGFVLLIACVNVANLLLARGTARQKEIAVRTSLGATRGQLFLQFLIESLALASTGGALGVALAWILVKVIVLLLPPYALPSEAVYGLNLQILLFTLATSVLSGVLCGCVPALQTWRTNLSDTLKEGGRSASSAGRHGLRRTLVVAEFALALTLLAGAGLVIHSFWKLTRVNLGFRQDHLLTFALPVSNDRFATPEQVTLFYRQLLEKIQTLPGVTSASTSTGLPMLGTNFGMPFSIVGQPVTDVSSRPGAGFNQVTPEFFHTLGIKMEKGRPFTEQDRPGSVPVAIVNGAFVKKFLSNMDPLTQRISVEQLISGQTKLGPAIEWQIVGVYENVHNGGVRGDGFPEIDVPFAQSPWPQAGIAARTSGDPVSMIKSIAAVVQTMDPDLALNQVKTMDQLVDESLAGDRFATLLFAIFAGVALLLAAIGIYGVMSFAVAQRTHEIGLRMALGAGAKQVLRLVLGEGMTLAFIGLGVGLVGTYLVSRALASTLYEVTVVDPAEIGAVAAVLLISALLACYLPARRATQVDPMVALRDE
jgi:putative ABC transport system permease protein